MTNELFTTTQIETLRTEFSKIEGIDPALPTYGKLTAFLNGLDQPKLKQLAGAKIKFLSRLALNRVIPDGQTWSGVARSSGRNRRPFLVS